MNRSNGTVDEIVVVGASAGGVEVLRQLVAGLPGDLAAAVLVMLHVSPKAPSALARILNRAGPLWAVRAEDEQPIEPGHIYVAPPDRQLVVNAGHLRLQSVAGGYGAHPSIDELFRSAARAYGRHVVGVVLSGALHDGALGLAAIKMQGGVTVVQDPDEALFSGMPQSALSTGRVDYCLRAADIPACLVELIQHRRSSVVDHA